VAVWTSFSVRNTSAYAAASVTRSPANNAARRRSPRCSAGNSRIAA
jgi:hypothetical protein